MTIAAVLRDKGSAVETIAADASRVRRRPAGSARNGSARLPVVEDGRIAGIISERDVIYCLRDHGAEVARLAGRAGDELAGDHRRSAIPTCWRRWR